MYNYRHIDTHETVVQWWGELLEVEPDIEGAGGRDLNVEVKSMKTS